MQASRSETNTVWRLQIEAFNVSVKCTTTASATAVPNPFSSPQLAKYMLSTYFARFPLWSRLSLGVRLQLSNATAEAGVRILKRAEQALPHKAHRPLRLDEYLAARIPKRLGQTRLLLTQIKRNWVRKRQDTADLSSKETWSKAIALPLSPAQFQLFLRLRQVVKWRRENIPNSTLVVFSQEISALFHSSHEQPSDDLIVAGPTISKFVNGKSWPTEHEVESALRSWVELQETKVKDMVVREAASGVVAHSVQAGLCSVRRSQCTVYGTDSVDGDSTDTAADSETVLDRSTGEAKLVSPTLDAYSGTGAAVSGSTAVAESTAAQPESSTHHATSRLGGTRKRRRASSSDSAQAIVSQGTVGQTTSTSPLSRRTRARTRASALAETKQASAQSDTFLVLKLLVNSDQLRPFGLVRFLSGLIDKNPPRNPTALLTGEVWEPADVTDLFGPYCASSPARTEAFQQGAVLYFDVCLDSVGRLPSQVERGLLQDFEDVIEDYHKAALEA